jgi:putative ABC transport system permease protein
MIVGVPPDTKLVKFRILEGRWLARDDDKVVVLNHMARAQAPDLKVGDVVSLWVENRPSQWKIAGYVEDIGSASATAYVGSNALAEVSRTAPGSSNNLRIAFDDRAQEAVIGNTRTIENALEKTAHIKVTLPVWMIQNAIAEHMSVLVSSLLALAILMAIVGAFGLASTMSMNIMERTREIGVMRAIGATPKVITQIVVTEGFAIAALSALFALGLSVALSSFMGCLIGNMAFRTPLPLAISTLGVALWMVILVFGSSAATILPAQRAANMTVREALAYE